MHIRYRDIIFSCTVWNKLYKLKWSVVLSFLLFRINNFEVLYIKTSMALQEHINSTYFWIALQLLSLIASNPLNLTYLYVGYGLLPLSSLNFQVFQPKTTDEFIENNAFQIVRSFDPSNIPPTAYEVDFVGRQIYLILCIYALIRSPKSTPT